jgi:DNA-binding beta-propeller fold protein YncE
MNRMAGLVGVFALSLALASVAGAAPKDDAAYRVLQRIHLGGEGGWDYVTVDAVHQRAYVARSTHVQVVDLASGAVAGDIPGTPGVHGVALVPARNRGYASNGRDSSVTVFDLGSLVETGRIRLPARNPDAILFDAASGRVFTMNGGSASLTAIDVARDSVVGGVVVDGKPEAAVTDGAGHLWVNLEDSSAVVMVDTRTLKVLHRWPIAPGKEPTGLAFDAAHRRLFAGCGNGTLVVVDADAGRVVATVPIGQGCDGVAFDAKRGLVLTSNGEGTLSVIREETPDRYVLVGNVPTERGARTLALDAVSGRVYLPTADFGPPPEPTPERPHPRPSIVPDSARLLVIGR